MRQDILRRIKTGTPLTLMMQALKTCRLNPPSQAHATEPLVIQPITTLVRLRPWQ